MNTYRYRWIVVSNQSLQQHVPGNPTVVGVTSVFADVNAEPSAKADLDEYMTSIGFVFVEENPETPATIPV